MVSIEHIFDEIGGFHFFQLLMIVWVYSIKFMTAWSLMLMSFGGYKPDYACITDGLLNQSSLKYMNDSQLREEAETGVNNETFLNVCDLNGTECDQFHFFGTKRTVVSEWDLVCDLRWMKATITSIQFGGLLTGSIIGGHSGDYFGRKKTLYGSYFLHTVFDVIAAYSVSWQMFTALRFFIGTMIGIILVVIVPYPTEFFPIRWRHTIPAIPMWPLGSLAFASGAWLFQDWAHLQLTCAVLALPGLLGYFYIPESARWLATRGRLDEAYAVLEKMARVNGKKLPPTAMDTIKEIAQEEKSSKGRHDYSYIDIFTTKAMAQLTVIFGFKWFVLSMVFYGLSFAVSSFAGDLYLNMFLMSVVELPAYLLSFLLIDRIGRRWTCLFFLVVTMLVSFTCVGLHLKAPEDLRDKLISACCLTAKLAVSACWSASQTWVTESYPTVTRSLGYGFANMTSRIGAIISPFVINLDQMPLFTFILMGAMTLVSMVITCFVPETQNKVMAETVHEQTMGAAGSQQVPGADNSEVPRDSPESGHGNEKNGLELDSQKLPSFVSGFMDSIPLRSDSENNAKKGVSNYGYTDTHESYRF
ncbi:hypothetical protein RRG08_013250 [Elysia crispata]|uniref:Major facilitator superfamily (MFS) profile domain-containing protein n=1 Tax=Elysia crispata TaxID=231223 RepID=A0AAE0ZTZ4_9GAST|nr:hypothetical protein RRG08_013250 [Elysia crispata]